jgi:hypothetical protein
MDKPADDMMAKPETGGMAFAEYWNPPTHYYGEPVYGGTLRINYEDPLDTPTTGARPPALRPGTTVPRARC